MRHVLLVAPLKRYPFWKQALSAIDYCLVAHFLSAKALCAQAIPPESEVIVAEGSTLAQATRLGGFDKPVVLFTHSRDPVFVQQALQTGITVVASDFSKEQILTAVETAITRFREVLCLKARIGQLQLLLAERKLIEKAKGLLMAQGLSEEEAFRLLRKTAMNHRLRLAEVAGRLVENKKAI